MTTCLWSGDHSGSPINFSLHHSSRICKGSSRSHHLVTPHLGVCGWGGGRERVWGEGVYVYRGAGVCLYVCVCVCVCVCICLCVCATTLPTASFNFYTQLKVWTALLWFLMKLRRHLLATTASGTFWITSWDKTQLVTLSITWYVLHVPMCLPNKRCHVTVTWRDACDPAGVQADQEG